MIRSTVPLFVLAFVASVPALASELVPVGQFHSLELRGGGDVVIAPGPVERVRIIEGSTRFTHIGVEPGGRLRIDSCNEECPHHYRLTIEIQSPRVPALAVGGGGTISVAPGFAFETSLDAAVNGGGKIDARSLEAGSVSAAVRGGGELLVRARSTLSGAVDGGGVVRYWGNPQVASAIRGGGSISPGY
jgi:hypothetical protein